MFLDDFINKEIERLSELGLGQVYFEDNLFFVSSKDNLSSYKYFDTLQDIEDYILTN